MKTSHLLLTVTSLLVPLTGADINANHKTLSEVKQGYLAPKFLNILKRKPDAGLVEKTRFSNEIETLPSISEHL